MTESEKDQLVELLADRLQQAEELLEAEKQYTATLELIVKELVAPSEMNSTELGDWLYQRYPEATLKQIKSIVVKRKLGNPATIAQRFSESKNKSKANGKVVNIC